MWHSIALMTYLLVSLAVTVLVARTLFTAGQHFLDDVFHGDRPLALTVNRFLVVGFYLVNAGLIGILLTREKPVEELAGFIEFLAARLGLVLIILGLIHFWNLVVLSWARRIRLRMRS